MYICFEGIKGSGKSTAFDLIKREFEQKNIPFSILCPTKPISGFHIREWLHSHISILRSFDWWNSWIYSVRSNSSALRALREKKSIILGDRSVLTSYVTKRTHGISWKRSIELVNRLEKIIPLPDVVIYFKIDPEIAYKRLQKRKHHFGVKKDESLTALHKASEYYEEIRNVNYPLRFSEITWIEVDGSLEQPELNQVLSSIIKSYFKQHSNDLHYA